MAFVAANLINRWPLGAGTVSYPKAHAWSYATADDLSTVSAGSYWSAARGSLRSGATLSGRADDGAVVFYVSEYGSGGISLEILADDVTSFAWE